MSYNPLVGYNGNINLKKPRRIHNWTSEQVQEWLKCAQDPIYFSEKYIQIVNVDKGLIPIELYDYQKEIITKITENRRVTVVTSRQAGKALDINTEIPTVDGWKRMKDIQIGDQVFDVNGNSCNVTFKSEIHLKPTYRVQFSDGTSVDCCEEHLWYVGDKQYPKKGYHEINTKNLLSYGLKFHNSNFENRFYIPVGDNIKYTTKNLPIDPYVFGLWLRGGISQPGIIVMLENDFNDIKHLIPYEYNIKRDDKKNQDILYIKIDGLYTKLQDAGWFNNKHIPKEYLLGDENQRMQLLRGLMDIGGRSQAALCTFTQTTKHNIILDSVAELISSLGYTYTLNSKNIRFSTHDLKVFNLKRKANKQKLTTHKKCRKRFITSITQIESIPTQCITVDSLTHTYRCTLNYIVTHNTTTTACVILHYILFNEFKLVALLANKGDAAREILDRIKLSYESLPDWLQQGVLVWNKGSIELENGCKVIAAATSSSSIRGKSVNLLYIDECVEGETPTCVEIGESYYYTSMKNLINIEESTFINKRENGMYSVVYKTINNINGKEYIGFHRISNESDILSESTEKGSLFKDGYLGSGVDIKQAIVKYKPENFRQELLFITDDINQVPEGWLAGPAGQWPHVSKDGSKPGELLGRK